MFLRAGQMAELDGLRTEVLGSSASIIQRKVRAYLARRHFILLQKSALCIQAFSRGERMRENPFFCLLFPFLTMNVREILKYEKIIIPLKY